MLSGNKVYQRIAIVSLLITHVFASAGQGALTKFEGYLPSTSTVVKGTVGLAALGGLGHYAYKHRSNISGGLQQGLQFANKHKIATGSTVLGLGAAGLSYGYRMWSFGGIISGIMSGIKNIPAGISSLCAKVPTEVLPSAKTTVGITAGVAGAALIGYSVYDNKNYITRTAEETREYIRSKAFKIGTPLVMGTAYCCGLWSFGGLMSGIDRKLNLSGICSSLYGRMPGMPGMPGMPSESTAIKGLTFSLVAALCGMRNMSLQHKISSLEESIESQVNARASQYEYERGHLQAQNDMLRERLGQFQGQDEV